MRILLFFLCLFAFCTLPSPKAVKNTTVRIKLGQNLPFRLIRLKKFDAAYGVRVACEYDSLVKNQVYEFRLNISEPGVFCLVDENDIGAGSIFVQPNDSLSLELYWPKNAGLSRKVLGGRYPGDNLLIDLLRDTFLRRFDLNRANSTEFKSVRLLNQYVETIFQKVMSPLTKSNAELLTSPLFAARILKPQIELLKFFYKNELLKKSNLNEQHQALYPDDVFARPNYQYWSSDYLEYNYFGSYLFERLNHSITNSLADYVKKVEEKYRNSDTAFLRIAVSRALASFADYSSTNMPKPEMAVVLNDLCNRYDLDRRKYGFLDFSMASLPSLDGNLFGQIHISSPAQDVRFALSQIIKDTSKVYYLDHWASWCGPCIKGLPYTKKLSASGNKNLAVLFLSIDKDNEKFLEAVKRYDLPTSQVFNLGKDTVSVSAYKKLNPVNHVPVYQMIFFSQGAWRVANASSADDPRVLLQLASIAEAKGQSNKPN